ncbi:hypothetical protein AGLY_003396 [Aphis glycines]|uniref:DDE-1 domain-containing protein n=1 Tax=Aphis glycines TaxID=307491 RepID=A0A6G0U0W9_APHGL|nr:hypothetical protein AGLY_003396 [Aphis glycines]
MNKAVDEVIDKAMTYREVQDTYELPKNTLLRMSHSDLSFQVPEKTSAARAMGLVITTFFRKLGEVLDKYKFQLDRIFNCDAPGIRFTAEFNPSGWMQTDIFYRWLQKFIQFTHASKNNLVILLLDGHATHTKNINLIDLARENGVFGGIISPYLQNQKSLMAKHCVGIATDGCSIMTSTVRGAVKYIQSNAAPNAVYSPCSNHCLNLSISKSSSVMSAKRNFDLKKVFGKEKHLMSLCETRWIKRHDSILIFKNSLQYIIKSLNLITEWQDNDSSVKAYSLLNSLTTCQTLISLLLYLTTPASKLLQASNTQPNTLSVSIEEYFRISVNNSLYDHVLDDLKYRFLNKKNLTVYKLLLLIPKHVVDIKSDDINYIAEIVDKEYSYLHIEKQYFTFELELWIAKWTRVKNEGKYKIIYYLLHLHKEKEVSTDNIIERFSKVKKRNIE